MTAVADAPQADIEGIAQPRAVVVGIMAGEGVQIGVLLDANAPVSVMTDALLKVVNSRLRELGEAPLETSGRGRWGLCLVDGTPLRATQSLTEQDIYDGDRLWIRFIADTERRSQVIEHISTAVSADLSKRFAAIDPVVAVQVGASMVAAGVITASVLLGWWRSHHNSWLPTIYGAVIGLLVLAVSLLLLARAKTVQDRRVGDVMLISSFAALTVGAGAAPPGPLGSPHALLGAAVLTVSAMLALRFTRSPTRPVHGHRHGQRGGDDREPGPDGRDDQCGDPALLCGAGLRDRLPRRAGPIPPAGRHPAAGVPVGHQPLGL